MKTVTTAKTSEYKIKSYTKVILKSWIVKKEKLEHSFNNCKRTQGLVFTLAVSSPLSNAPVSKGFKNKSDLFEKYFTPFQNDLSLPCNMTLHNVDTQHERKFLKQRML